MWNGCPPSSNFSVELCRFIPSFAAHSAVALVAAPHQMRSRKPSGMRLEAQQARRVGEHRPRVGLGEPFAFQHVEENFRVAAGHVGVGLPFRRARSRNSASRR